MSGVHLTLAAFFLASLGHGLSAGDSRPARIAALIAAAGAAVCFLILHRRENRR